MFKYRRNYYNHKKYCELWWDKSEDIAAPDCFVIEKKLKEILDIPVFHDDQHGTAIITLAALLNALIYLEKRSRSKNCS